MKRNTQNEKYRSGMCYVGTTADGIRVYDRRESHLHLEGGLTMELISEAISRVRTSDELVTKETVEFGCIIGKTTCVRVDPAKDEIVYIRRGNRPGLTPMVKNREPEDCSCVTVVLIRHGNDMKLLTAYIGKGAPKEPWDLSIRTAQERLECEAFWKTHALAMGCPKKDDTVKRGRKTTHYVGETSHKLTVIEITDRRTPHGEIILRCRCECGNVTEVRGSDFYRNRTCGCEKCGYGDHVDGTCLHMLTLGVENGKMYHVGVRRTRYGKWEAKIKFRGKTIYLGTFDSYEDAVAERENAEALYFLPILEKYGRLPEDSE